MPILTPSIVGYQTSTIVKGRQQTFALQFQDITNPGDPIRVDKLFTNTFTAGAAWTGCDQIWAWSTANNKWSQYAYYSYNRGGVVKPAGWYKYDSSLSGYNAFTPITDDDVINPGNTFIFKHLTGATGNSITLTLSGQVNAFDISTVSYSIVKSRQEFICYPWPVALKIGDLDSKATISTLTAGAAWTGCDQIWAWSTANNKWAQYAYYSYNRGGVVKPAGWYKYDSSLSGYNAFTPITDEDKIEPGQGFLYKHLTGATGNTLTLTWKALQSAE